MNIIELQERLKDLPEQSLMQEMQNPTGTAPQFLVLGELKRRKRMRDDYQRMQAQNTPTVAEETVAAAGVPQQGIMQMARATAPKSAIAQNTGVNDMMQREATRAPQPEAMADGGYVRRMAGGTRVRKMQEGGPPGTTVSLFGIKYTLMPDGSIIDPTGKPLDPNNASISPLIERLKEEANRLNEVAVNAGATPISGVVEGGKGEGLASLIFDATTPPMPPAPSASAAPGMPPAQGDFHEPSGLYFDEMTDQQLATVANGGDQRAQAALAQRSGAVPEVAGGQPLGGSASQTSPTVPPASGMDSQPAPGTPPSIESQIADLGITPEQWANLTPDEQQNILNFEDPTQGMRERWDEFRNQYPPQPPTGRGFFIETFSPDRARRLREEAARRNSEERAVAADAARAPRRVENQALSFGLPPADLPSAGAGLSFGNITPSAAEIPLSTGREGAAEPTPEFPLGTPVEAPAAAISSAEPNQSGAGSYGSIESRIAKMLADREKSAEADKWLALAQTGLALMASRQPTIGGAIGEAGLAGIGAMQKARSQYDKEVLDLLDMQAGIQRAKASGARASSSTSGLNSMIDDARQELSALNSEARSYRKVDVDDFGEARLVDLTPKGLRLAIVAAEDRLATLNALRSGSASTAQFDATAQ